MVTLIIVSCIMFVLGSLGLCAVLMAGRASNGTAPTTERPSRTVRVIRDPRFGLERHEHGWRGDEE